jgi:hypothetical protein
VHELREEASSYVFQEHAWKQACLAENLKSVTDTQDSSALSSKIFDRFHHRRKLGERSSAEVISVRETSWKHDKVRFLQIRISVPHRISFGVEELAKDVKDVLVAIRSREYDDGNSHVTPP